MLFVRACRPEHQFCICEHAYPCIIVCMNVFMLVCKCQHVGANFCMTPHFPDFEAWDWCVLLRRDLA